MINPYPVNNIDIPTLSGRQNELNKLIRQLTKSTPDHVSVIGPKFIGKTVFLKSLYEYFIRNSSPFLIVLYWDIRHVTPQTDQDFYDSFINHLRPLIQKLAPSFSCIVIDRDKNTTSQSILKDLFELLADDQKKILVILDGLDEMLRSENITRNLWDSLRNLAEHSSLRFVTGSRRRLRELCISPDSRTSDFWNIFYETPLRIEPFNDSDWNVFLQPLLERGIIINSNVSQVLQDWTGRIPVLAALLASRIFENHPTNTPIVKKDIDNIAEEVLNNSQDHIVSLWNDCPAEMQGDLYDISVKGEILSSEIPLERREFLEHRGYVKLTGNKLKPNCQLMSTYAKLKGENLSDLRRVFGSKDKYENHIQTLLELRLAQLVNIDRDLKDYVEMAVRQLKKPHIAIQQIRGICDRTFEIIWSRELTDKKIPPQWTSSWKDEGEKNPPSGSIAEERYTQLYLLRLMVNPRKSGQTCISRPTLLLLNYLHEVGNLGQHRNGEEIPLPFIAAVCLAAIELCELLTRDIEKIHPPK